MAKVAGRRGCSGMINLGLSVILLGGLAWFFTQDKFSLTDITKKIGNISGASPTTILLTLPITDSPNLDQSDVLVIDAERDVERRKNTENQYEIYLSLRSAIDQKTTWKKTLTSLYKDGYKYLKATYDREHIYIVIKDQVYALSRKDGTKLWSLRLRDQLSPECSNCVELIERKLMILTEERILYSVNSLNGNILKKNRLETPKAQGVGFYGVKNKIVLTDQIEDNPKVSASVIVLNPITLMPLRFFTPTPHRKIDSGKVYKVDMPLIFDKTGSYIYLMPEGTHIQCWDIDNGHKKWDRLLPARMLLPDKLQDLKYVEHQTSIYLSATIGAKNALIKVDMLDGKFKELSHEIDYMMTPILARKNLLLTFTQKVRGNKRAEIWAMDQDNGSIVWRYPLRNIDLYDPATKKGTTYCVLYKDGLLVMQYLKETKQILVEKLNPMTGNLIKKTVKDVLGEQWNQITETPHQVYFSMEKLYRLDMKAVEVGEFEY